MPALIFAAWIEEIRLFAHLALGHDEVGIPFEAVKEKLFIRRNVFVVNIPVFERVAGHCMGDGVPFFKRGLVHPVRQHHFRPWITADAEFVDPFRKLFQVFGGTVAHHDSAITVNRRGKRNVVAIQGFPLTDRVDDPAVGILLFRVEMNGNPVRELVFEKIGEYREGTDFTSVYHGVSMIEKWDPAYKGSKTLGTCTNEKTEIVFTKDCVGNLRSSPGGRTVPASCRRKQEDGQKRSIHHL